MLIGRNDATGKAGPVKPRSTPLKFLLAGVLLSLATPASAQFGSIFGGPPRPPGDVPSGYPVEQVDPRLPPRDYDPRFDQPTPPPPPLTRFPGGAVPGAVQTQPLPPPPGVPPTQPGDQAARPGQPPLTGLPPGQRQPRGTPQAPGEAAAPPTDEVVVGPPAQKIVNATAIFAGLDKITGRIISFDVAINETVQFGALRLTPRACYTRPPTETPNTDGFVEVDEITLQGEVKRIFTGWMFAASPGLHGVEHPIYDLWLTDCKKEPPSVAGAQAQSQQQAPAEPAAAQPAQAAPSPAPSRGGMANPPPLRR